MTNTEYRNSRHSKIRKIESDARDAGATLAGSWRNAPPSPPPMGSRRRHVRRVGKVIRFYQWTRLRSAENMSQARKPWRVARRLIRKLVRRSALLAWLAGAEIAPRSSNAPWKKRVMIPPLILARAMVAEVQNDLWQEKSRPHAANTKRGRLNKNEKNRLAFDGCKAVSTRTHAVKQ